MAFEVPKAFGICLSHDDSILALPKMWTPLITGATCHRLDILSKIS